MIFGGCFWLMMFVDDFQWMTTNLKVVICHSSLSSLLCETGSGEAAEEVSVR
jgi:hypothetical protein